VREYCVEVFNWIVVNLIESTVSMELWSKRTKLREGGSPASKEDGAADAPFML
jgi:hypothetical protein